MKYLVHFLLSVFSFSLWACPQCGGGLNGGMNTLIVLTTFILLIYFPLFFLFKMIRKYGDEKGKSQ